MAEANIHSAPWSLDILRKDRLAMACLVLSVTFLGCHALPPPEASLEREAVTSRREWRPLDADRATAERLGREVVEAIGYEGLIEMARRAGFVTTKKIKRRVQRKHGSLFAMDEAETTPPAVSAAPMPTTTAPPMPTTTAPVMPSELSTADQERWRTCNQLHNTYKATQREVSDYARPMDPLEALLQNNKASAQQRREYCSLLDKRIKLVQRLHKERSKYIELDCDRFDWLNKGTTAAARLARHQAELNKVDAELKNLYDLNKRFCQ